MDAVYIETSIISYLRQKPAKEVVTASHQLLTHQWWDTERANYNLVVSQYGNTWLTRLRLAIQHWLSSD